MKALTRILGAAAAVAAGAAAVYAVSKALAKESNTYAELAHETAEPAEPMSKAPEAVQQAAADLAAGEDAPAEEAAPTGTAAAEPAAGTIRFVPSADTPNPNPVDAAPAVAPRTADGKIDVTKLIDPADFADWDDLGCKS